MFNKKFNEKIRINASQYNLTNDRLVYPRLDTEK